LNEIIFTDWRLAPQLEHLTVILTVFESLLAGLPEKTVKTRDWT
jgi:hypothetical protein